MDFDDFKFHPQVRAGVTAAGYNTPTPIQAQAIPRVLQGGDVMGIAQTGTGKTAAFVLPMLHRLLAGRRSHVCGLIIAPTRELAEQINESILELGKETGIRSLTIYGGVNAKPQVAKLKQGVDIVVACPGRLLDHLNQGNLDLSHLETLVLDEADHMFDMGFLPDIRRIIKYIPEKRQTLLFSATMPNEIRRLAQEVLQKPTTVQVDTVAPAKTVSHVLYPVEPHLKTAMLLELLQLTKTESVLVFARTKYRAKRLGEKLVKSGYRAASLQGNLSQNKRQAALNGFRDGSFQILVATDIAARGIDVSLISHVINYDIPDTADAYIHRIGRTGRAARNGNAYTLVSREDQIMIRAIERVLGSPLERCTVDGFDYSVTSPRKNTEFARPPRQPQPRRKPGRQGQAKPVQTNQQGDQPKSATRAGKTGKKNPKRSGLRRGRGTAPLGLNLQAGRGGGQGRGGR
ncbi:ATP-dependent RNA helicase RhlE [bacterium BMS3Bbin14]|nr:ATP-dependent RNA helicase RhlE [bacterium BMS3Bbin14]